MTGATRAIHSRIFFPDRKLFSGTLLPPSRAIAIGGLKKMDITLSIDSSSGAENWDASW